MEKKKDLEAPVCECKHDPSAEIKVDIPEGDELFSLGEFFKVFGEVSRLKILYLLLGRELCVCDIARGVGASVSAVSHQLKILKGARLVKFRKEGKSCFYSLSDDHISGILSLGMEHIEE
ncbi:MAG: helix-turn-helix transcriptional regulator [Clostridia bacterium]|nr:helix-turn-helix transcriptional regulator [Clostridia bacterium]